MAAHATTHLPVPAVRGQRCRATVIVLDGEQTIRLEQGKHLLGYFASVETLSAHVDLAEVDLG